MPSETAADIEADLAVLRAARTKLALGERPDSVMRNGRRMDFGKVTLEELTSLIMVREQDYERAVNVEAGRPTRSAIRFGYGR